MGYEKIHQAKKRCTRKNSSKKKAKIVILLKYRKTKTKSIIVD